jgi:hypothetical protein
VFNTTTGELEELLENVHSGELLSKSLGRWIGIDFMYTRKNAQVVTGLQTSCYKSVHKLLTSCVRTACS